jgi:hypothetical protein
MSGPGVGLLVMLLKAVARLALPAEDQVAYLRRLGSWPSVDELALELDDVVELLGQFVASGWITEQDADAIRALDDLLGRMSGDQNEHLWTEHGLTTANEWEEVRKRARDIVLAG